MASATFRLRFAPAEFGMDIYFCKKIIIENYIFCLYIPLHSLIYTQISSKCKVISLLYA